MKKLLVTLLTAAMTVGLLAGCGNDSGDSGSGGHQTVRPRTSP